MALCCRGQPTGMKGNKGIMDMPGKMDDRL